MSLPDVYAKAIPADHLRALEDAISWAVDHALEDLASIETADAADHEIVWDDLAFLCGLPVRYRHRYTPLFAKQFVVCLIAATLKMGDPERVGQGMLSCVAEEIAVHLVIQEAEAMLRTVRTERGQSEEGIEFGDLYELMFEDIDFEWLYDPEMDGIEHDAAAAAELGIGNLVFERWFSPFSRRFVHPYVSEPPPEDSSR
jgi:hypothetical protein